MSNTLKFKSNINCTGCLATVTPVLNNENRIKSWSVDLESEDRLLEINSNELGEEEVIALIKSVGFNLETK